MKTTELTPEQLQQRRQQAWRQAMAELCSAETTIRIFNLPFTVEEVYNSLVSIYRVEVEKTGHKANMTPELLRAIQETAEWIVRPKRVGLKLIGEKGLGKSTLIKAMRMFINTYHRTFCPKDSVGIRWVDAGEIVEQCLRPDVQPTNTYEAFSITALGNSRGVIAIDDIGKEEPSVKYYGSTIMPIADIIQLRANKDLPTICITNLNEQELLKAYGSRVVDRLKDFTTIMFTGTSHRNNRL